jgi:hypothetical protein
LLAALLFAVACSESSGPEDAQVDGTWRFSYNNMTGSLQGITVSCTVSTADFVITQTGSTFSGIQQGSARMTCASGAQTVSDGLVSGETIVDGEVSGNTLSFRLGSISGPHNGRVSGGSMTGTCQWVFASGNTTITLTGDFNAARL